MPEMVGLHEVVTVSGDMDRKADEKTVHTPSPTTAGKYEANRIPVICPAQR
jgi:hypothetical protein